MPVHPADVPNTVIITPFDGYVFHYSTFGLKNSGATIQGMIVVVVDPHLHACLGVPIHTLK